MKLWTLSDPHLALSTPSKAMHVFGEEWRDHENTIRERWTPLVAPEDVVLLPGDISWARKLDDALTDLEFLHRLPGRKVLLEGNHDRWWESASQVRRALPPSISILSGDHLAIGPWLLFGTRLWEHAEANVDRLIAWNRLSDKTPENRTDADREHNERIWAREVERLRKIVAALPDRPDLRRVCLTHYPPIGMDLAPNRATEVIESSGADLCVFGHLHSIRREFRPPHADLMGRARGVRYVLASCDYRRFEPVLLDDTTG